MGRRRFWGITFEHGLLTRAKLTSIKRMRATDQRELLSASQKKAISPSLYVRGISHTRPRRTKSAYKVVTQSHVIIIKVQT